MLDQPQPKLVEALLGSLKQKQHPHKSLHVPTAGGCTAALRYYRVSRCIEGAIFTPPNEPSAACSTRWTCSLRRGPGSVHKVRSPSNGPLLLGHSAQFQKTPGAFVWNEDGQVQGCWSTELLRWCHAKRLGLGIYIHLSQTQRCNFTRCLKLLLDSCAVPALRSRKSCACCLTLTKFVAPFLLVQHVQNVHALSNRPKSLQGRS